MGQLRSLRLFTTGDNGEIVMADIGGTVTNKELMMEKIVKFLLTIPGSNIVDPSYGSLLADKAYLARFGNDLASIKLLILTTIDAANAFFKGNLSITNTVGKTTTTTAFDHMELTNLYVSEDDPTVFYSEILVYFSDGTVYNITV